MTISMFISYSHLDAAACVKLQRHLAPLQREGIQIWTDERILPGEDIERAIHPALKKAQIVLSLISSHYLSSPYCWDREWKYANGRRQRGHAHVVAIVLRSCDWKRTNVARFKALPHDGKPVTEWVHQDKAYTDVVTGIRRVVAEVRRQQQGEQPPRRRSKTSLTKPSKAGRPTTPKPPVSKKVKQPKKAASTTRRVVPRASRKIGRT